MAVDVEGLAGAPPKGRLLGTLQLNMVSHLLGTPLCGSTLICRGVARISCCWPLLGLRGRIFVGGM